jgi:hypothetical protein
MRDEVSLPQAQAAMTTLAARLASEFPDEDPGRGISVVRSDTVRIHPEFDGPITATMPDRGRSCGRVLPGTTCC